MTAQTYVMGRLDRWSVWYKSGADPKPSRVISSWGPLIMNRNVQQIGLPKRPHVDQSEAIETDKAVDALIWDLRNAVHVTYIGRGTMEQKAKDLGIERRALYYRLDHAYNTLLGYFNDQAAGIPLPKPDQVKNNLTPLHKILNIRTTVA